MDLGSGAGFPGVPIKILLPSLQLMLVDSKRMKSLFLLEVVEQLNLSKTNVLCERVESLVAADYPDRFDVIVSRAVASLKKVWEWSAPLLKRPGFLAVHKGGDLSEETEDLQRSFSNIRIKTISIHPTFDAPENNRRIVLVSQPEEAFLWGGAMVRM